jgi:hypothetical protein
MSREVVLHIGTHRTGTTAIQQALADQRDGLLARAGYRFPESLVLPNNHIELSFVSMRPDRLAEIARFYDWALERLGNPVRSCQDPIWGELVRNAVESFSATDAVYSCEALCWLRQADEIDRILELFSGSSVSVALFVREPAAYLESYQWMMQWLGYGPSDDPASMMYLQPDSWLVDYEAMAAPWRRALGSDRVHVISYEACMRATGSTVPALFGMMGFDSTDAQRVGDYFLNARPSD